MGLFSGKKIKQFAKELTDNLAKRYPPTLDVTPEKRVSEARLTRVLEETLAKATTFQQEQKLGVFGKAKLANEFKWQLKERGYSEKFIEVATEGLTVYVTRGTEQSSSATANTKR
jgi:hypothetical protein